MSDVLDEIKAWASCKGHLNALSVEASAVLIKMLLTYDSETGVLIWNYRPMWMFSDNRDFIRWNATYAGVIAGKIDSRRYRVITVFSRTYQAHRLIWLYVHGSWPQREIDHINHVRDDNRLRNLRDATRVDNRKNQSKRVSNKSGITGVFWSKAKNKWYVQIGVKNKRIHVGCFDDINDAVKAREKANDTHGFHINHGI